MEFPFSPKSFHDILPIFVQILVVMSVPKYYFLPAVLWFALIFVLLVMPSRDFEGTALFHIPYFDKVVHAGLFGALVFWCALPLARRVQAQSKTLVRITVYASLYGVLMEYVQKYFTTSRSFDPTDMIADTAGAVLAYWVMRYIFRKVQAKKGATEGKQGN